MIERVVLLLLVVLLADIAASITTTSNRINNKIKSHRLLASSLPSSSSSSSFDSTINYQIHSNNDVRELHQLMLKGASRFKFDPHFVDATNCKYAGIEDPRGCLLLNHDTPAPRLTNYSSANDLLSFFKSSQFQSLKGQQPVTAAFCFKSAPDLCNFNSTNFNNWLALADEFFSRAMSELEGVEVILDGDAKPVKCLVGRWTPLVSVWIGTSSPQAAFTSNDINNDLYRYQILNNPESFSNWTWLAQEDYGKFSSSTKYPYQLWEPDRQADYLSYIDIYHSGKTHPPGFHFAINTDISMFETYVASRTGRGVNALVQPTASAAASVYLPFLSTPSHLFIYKDTSSSSSSSSSSPSWGYMTASLSSISPFFDLSLSPAQALPITQLNSLSAARALPITQLNSLSAARALSLSSSLSILLLLSEDGAINIMSIDKEGALGAAMSTSLSGLLARETCFDILPLSSSSSNTNTNTNSIDVIVTSALEGQIYLSTYRLSFSSSSSSLSAELVSRSPLINTPTITNIIRSVKLAPLSSSSSSSSSSILISASINDVITISSLSIDPSTLSLLSSPSSLSWSSASVGRSISIDTIDNIIMLTNDYGYCYNSHKHNTRSYPSMCDSRPLPSQYVIDYSIGLASDWASIFSSSSSSSSSTTTPRCPIDLSTEVSPSSAACFSLTVCGDRLLHGSMNQGSNPSLSLGLIPSSSSSSSSSSSLYFLEAHTGVPSSVSINNECGEPDRADGIVLSGLPLQLWREKLLI